MSKIKYGALNAFKQFITSMRDRGVRFTFHGTQEEWDALTDAEKGRYDEAQLYDGVPDEADKNKIYKKIWVNNLGPSGLQGTIEAVRCGNVVTVKLSALQKTDGSYYVAGDNVTTDTSNNALLDYSLPTAASNRNDGVTNDNTHFILHGNSSSFILATCYIQHDTGSLRAETVYGADGVAGPLFGSITYITDDSDYDYSDWDVIG